MRKVKIYLATSLDGYIADKNGGVGWLIGDGSEPENMGTYPKFIEAIDTVILGYSTYNQIVTELSPNEWPYLGKKSYVLTSKEIENDLENDIIFLSTPIEDLITSLKKKDGKDIWICGGANIVNQILEKELFDEISVIMIPTILGDGIPLFNKSDKEIKLKLKSIETYNGITDALYVKRD